MRQVQRFDADGNELSDDETTIPPGGMVRVPLRFADHIPPELKPELQRAFGYESRDAVAGRERLERALRDRDERLQNAWRRPQPVDEDRAAPRTAEEAYERRSERLRDAHKHRQPVPVDAPVHEDFSEEVGRALTEAALARRRVRLVNAWRNL